MMSIKKIFLFLFALFTTAICQAQSNEQLLQLLLAKGIVNQKEADSIRAAVIQKSQPTENRKNLIIDLQIKNRFEYRNGYGNIPNTNSTASAFVNQRNRLNLSYQEAQKLNAVLSLQDARVWGSHDPKALNGTVQLFEGYVEPYLTPNFSIRIGRQRISYDNQRLFAENEWRVNGAAHDAINFRYQTTKFTSEVIGAFNQTSERLFGTDFTPTELSTTPSNGSPGAWSNYKALLVHYLKYNFKNHINATTIIAADAYQDAIAKEQNYWRFTYGGRLEFKKERWYVTTNSYLQTGRSSSGKTIKAWYIQPELKYTIYNLVNFRLGAEIFSGDNGTIGAVDHNFSPLYGVAHRFNGSLDLFTKFPTDVSNAGLVNPYFNISTTVGEKIELSSNNHLFYTQKKYITTTNATLTKFMGYEHDLMITYRPNTSTTIEGGFSVALPTSTLTAIKKTGDADQIACWTYIQLKFTPTLFKSTF